jgi:probable F420-dependent oxidoreductase
MRLGLMMFPTDLGVQPIEIAREAEARGFDSLWFPEHSHIPVSRRTPWGGREGAPPLPEEYWRTHDQFLALAAAAAVTTDIQLGTGITLVAQRDPLWLAKEVATIDQLSNGRFLFGVGYGWNHEEMESHGVDPRRRRALVREKILACKELWAKEEASFDGEFVRFEASWAWPKPVQQPHPPIVLGCSITELHLRHIVEYGDAWMPIQGRFDIAEGWAAVQRAASDAGRDPASLRLGVFAARPERENLDALRGLGTAWAALVVPPLDRDAALATLDSYAPLVEAYH